MIQNTFDLGREGWKSYKYGENRKPGGINYPRVTWESSGGVGNTGYVWSDDSRWSIDEPEKPHSILALIYYWKWGGGDPVDLRDARVSVYLRGDGLDLKGANCHFWAHVVGCRWHFSSLPIEIYDRKWGPQPTIFTLKNDESLWNRSYSGVPPKPVSLNDTIGESVSYGFSFIGFSSKVTGRLAIDEIRIETAMR